MSLLEEVKFIGNNLVRPECVLVDKNETLHIADWRGGVTLITKKGYQQTILAKGNFIPKPNGIAIHPNGGWLLTHLGDDTGGVYRLYNNGKLVPFLLEIDAVRNRTIGVARPRAQGHAITKIAIVELIVSEKSFPRIKNLIKKFIKLKSKIEGTKIFVILFTSS